MSKYTTEVRFICEVNAGCKHSEDYESVNDIVEKARKKLFGDYPIFDEAYRRILENKILKHYYTREICEETVGLWKLRLNNKMNEIMPYYNKLYESELLKFNPLYEIDYTKETKRNEESNGDLISKNNGKTENNTVSTDKIETDGKSNRFSKTHENGNTESNSVSNNNTDRTEIGNSSSAGNANTINNGEKTQRDLYSETPQGALNGVESEEYLTNARKITDKENSEQKISNTNDSHSDDKIKTEENGVLNSTENRLNTAENKEDVETKNKSTEKRNTEDKINYVNERNDKNNVKTIEDYCEHIYGKQSSTTFSKLLKDFRETFINIDMMIIKELNGLFFGLW